MKRTVTAIALLNLLFLAAVCWSSVAVQPVAYDSTKLGGVRWLADNFDRLSYAYRGQWLPRRAVPYRDVWSDYPVPMTLYYGLPFLAANGAAGYLVAFSVGNWLWLLILLAVTAALAAGARRGLLLYACPLTAWFVFNRYDIIPVTLVAWALRLLCRERVGWAGLALGVALNAKWYPAALVLPILLHLRHADGNWRRAGRFAAVLAAVTAACHAAGWALAGPASLGAYAFHFSRATETASLVGIGEWLLGGLGLAAAAPALGLVQFAAGLALFALPVRWQPRTREQLWALLPALVVLVIASSRVCSPQWVLWPASLAVLGAPRWRTVALALTAVALAYLRFPIAYDLMGDTHPLYRLAALAAWGGLALLAADRLRAVARP